MEAIQAMLTRKSIRKFTDAPVKDDDLRTILDCGRMAPSGANRQAWKFIVIVDQERKEQVAAVCDYGHFIHHAPVLIAVASEDAATACPNEDTAAAMENMLLAAHALGYGGCWIGSNGYAPLREDPENPHNAPYNTSSRVGKVLGVPEGWRIMALCCIGVPAEDPAPRPRKTAEEVISYNHF